MGPRGEGVRQRTGVRRWRDRDGGQDCGLQQDQRQGGQGGGQQEPGSGRQGGVEFERRVFHGLFGSRDQKIGMNAFAEKKKPEWTHG